MPLRSVADVAAVQRDDVAVHIGHGEHDASGEVFVSGFGQHAQGLEFIEHLAGLRQDLMQSTVGVTGAMRRELLGVVEPAALEVRKRFRALGKILLIDRRNAFEQLRRSGRTDSRSVVFLFSRFRRRGHKAVIGHEAKYGLAEREAVELHDQVDHAAPGVTAQAVEQVLARSDHEGRFVFVVEGALADQIGAAVFAKLDAARAAEGFNGDVLFQVVQISLAELSSSIVVAGHCIAPFVLSRGPPCATVSGELGPHARVHPGRSLLLSWRTGASGLFSVTSSS